MRNTKRIALSLTLPLTLTGCMGIYEGGFECPPGEGAKCKSISEVNAMVNQGTLPPPALVASVDSVNTSPDMSADTSCCGDSCLSCGEQESHASCKTSESHEIWWGPGAFMIPDEERDLQHLRELKPKKGNVHAA